MGLSSMGLDSIFYQLSHICGVSNYCIFIYGLFNYGYFTCLGFSFTEVTTAAGENFSFSQSWGVLIILHLKITETPTIWIFCGAVSIKGGDVNARDRYTS
jgi:hypothetical protein